MNLNFFITVIFYTIVLLIVHSKLKEHENRSVIFEEYENQNENVKADLPYDTIDTVVDLSDIKTTNPEMNKHLLKYLNIEKKDSANKSNNNPDNLNKYFPCSSEETYTFKDVPTSLEHLENFDGLNQSEPDSGLDNKVPYAFQDFEPQYCTI